MAATFYNFPIEQGSAFQITFQYLDEAGNSIDLTNWCVLLQWQTNNDDLYIFSNRDSSDNYKITTDTNGNIVLQIPAKTTNSYNFDSAVYDLDLQEPNEQYANSGLKTYRLASGVITIIKRNISANLADCANISQSPNTNLTELCLAQCSQTDLYSTTYDGASITIADNTVSSGTISTSDNRTIENIDIIINGLTHSNPQDLSLILAPPSGDKILLSANNKIKNYKPGFVFGFSNKAPQNLYLNDVNNGGLCNILDKRSYTKYNNENLLSSTDHLIGYSVSGNWTLLVRDSDIGVSGILDSWKLIITYSE